MSAQSSPRDLLVRLFAAAVDAADPGHCVPPHLPPPPRGRTVVVGAGKAAAAMARAVEMAWPDDRPLTGLVITRYGHNVASLDRIAVVEAGHPLPDTAGAEATGRMLTLVGGLSVEDLVLCMISGGASALMTLPADGIDLQAKQSVTKALLRSGAAIHEINCVRKHLSAVKGGRLAIAAAPAPVVTLMISDVPGDDATVIGSGPTVPDPTSLADARAVIERYKIDISASVKSALQDPIRETPKPGDAAFIATRSIIVAKPQAALSAAAKLAESAGFTPVLLGDAIEGEASEVGKVMAAIARSCALHGQPARPPCALISGGETTVSVKGLGRGGRNVEFLLSLAIALTGHKDIYAIACDTDGIDGTQDNAGAILAPDTLARAAALGLDAKAFLAGNDAYSFFAALGDLIVTGPTLTNVNDFRAILIGAPENL